MARKSRNTGRKVKARRRAPARRRTPASATWLRDGLRHACRSLAVLALLIVAGTVMHLALRPVRPPMPTATIALAPPVKAPAPVEQPPRVAEVEPPAPTPPLVLPQRPHSPTPAVAIAPTWRLQAVKPPPVDGRPMIAVMLDDVGLVRRNADAAAALDGAVTLSFMSYAADAPAQVAQAKARGHEIMVHVPMEPIGHAEDPGPNALLTSLPPEELARRVEWTLTRFDGYVGINNHMGSRFTTDRQGMSIVMAALKARGLLFVDSRTIATSVGADEARRWGVPSASRDVFLDNELGATAIDARLADAEKRARQQGFAIAIGHPHPETIAALRRWIPQARARGFVLVPISTIVARNLTD